MFISGAGSTQVLVVMARTGEAGPKGISAFVVPADAEGISYGKAEEKWAGTQPTRLVTFENMRIPQDHLLGQRARASSLPCKGLMVAALILRPAH